MPCAALGSDGLGLYLLANHQERVDENAVVSEIGKALVSIEGATQPLSTKTTELSESMSEVLKIVLSAAESIRNIYPSLVRQYGRSPSSMYSRTENDDGLSSSGNSSTTGTENVEPSGRENDITGSDMTSSPEKSEI